MSPLWPLSYPWWQFLLRGSVVYIAVLLLLRLAGKRQVGQMGTGEFVAILLISNAVQNAMNGGDNSITGGLILAAVIVALSALVAYLTYKSRRCEAIFEGTPALLVHQGKVLNHSLEKELLSLHELKTMLRKQGVHAMDEIEDAILESNGQLSIIRKADVAAAKIANGARESSK